MLKKWLVVTSLLVATHQSLAADDGWDDDWSEAETTNSDAKLPVTGFLQLFASQRTVDNPLLADDRIASEARARLEYSQYISSVLLSYKGDIYYDAIDDRLSANNREAFVGFSPDARADVKIGRQILTWGTGDLVFLNDLFPKNWVAFFSGEDQQYLKAPSDAIKVSMYTDSMNGDLVWSPEFDSDIFLTGDRLSYYSPLYNRIVAAPPTLQAQRPGRTLNNGEIAGRLYKTVQGIEYAGYFYRGFYKTPEGYDQVTGELYFPRLNAYGASMRGPAWSGIGNIEFALHDSVEDSAGTNPFIPNSETRFLLGYEQEVVTNLTGALQYYVEYTHNRSDIKTQLTDPTTAPDLYRQVITTRLTLLTLQNNLTWSFFMFYSPTDQDFYLLPSVKYRINDAFEVSGGGNYFKGRQQHTMFGQFEGNSNVYVRAKYIF